MEKTQLEYVVDKMRQETHKVLGEWILLQQYLGELKGICEEQEKLIRDLQTQKQQVRTSSWLSIRSSSISSSNSNQSTNQTKCGYTYQFTHPPTHLLPHHSHDIQMFISVFIQQYFWEMSLL